MRACLKWPSFYMCLAGLVTVLVLWLCQPMPMFAQESVEQSKEAAMTALKSGQAAAAESIVRAQIARLEGDTAISTEKLNDASSAKRDLYRVLSTVLAARAYDADQQAQSKSLTGNDAVMLIVIVLLAGSLLLIVIKHGPQRPKIVDQTAHWMSKVKHEIRDDSVRQFNSVLFTMLMFALIAAGLFGGLMMTMHLVAALDSNVYENPLSRKYFEEAKKAAALARSPKDTTAQLEDPEVLLLYSSFLHNVGNEQHATAVARRAMAMRNHTRKCQLPALKIPTPKLD